MSSDIDVAASTTTAAQKKHRTWPLRMSTISTIVVVILALFLWHIGVFGGNIHEVVPGQAYRSAQLTGHNLDTVLAADHIKTVINLRGGSNKDAWYRSELQSCRTAGADHVDVTLSANHLPAPEQLTKLLYALDHSKKPVIWHCQAGADRAGLTGTIYLNVYQNVPLDQAEDRQLTWHYGHFYFGDTHAMNDFFNLYRQTNGGLSLRDWIVKTYPKVYRQQAS